MMQKPSFRNSPHAFIDSVSFHILKYIIALAYSFFLIKKTQLLLSLDVSLYLTLLLSVLLFGILIFAIKKADMFSLAQRSRAYSLLLSILCLYAYTLFTSPGKSILWVFIYLFTTFVLYNAFEGTFTKPVILTADITAFILATFAFLGYQMKNYSGFNIYLFLIVEYLCLILFLICMFCLLFQFLSEHCFNSTKQYSRRKDISFFVLTVFLIFLCWTPYLILFFPGCLSSDSFGEIHQYFGISPLSNHHPIIHQLFIRFCLNIGKLFTEYQSTAHVTLSCALYSIIQMALMASVYSYALLFLRKKGVKKIGLFAVFSYFAFVPFNAFFCITMTKDVLFAGVTILLLILFINNAEESSSQKTRIHSCVSAITLIIVSFLFCTYRNNGYYAFIIAMPFFIIINRKAWKRFTFIFIATLIIVTSYKFLLFDILGIQRSSSRESMSVPLQQIACVFRNNPDEVYSEEGVILSEVFSEIEKIGEKYDPTYSNPVTTSFSASVYDQAPQRYNKCWLSLGIRHPTDYFAAFFMQNYGYWYPDVAEWTALTFIYQPNSFNLEQTPTFSDIRNNIAEYYNSLSYQQPLAALFSIGLMTWAIIVCTAILLLKGQKACTSVLLFLFGIWFTNLASPKYCEFRYIYSLIVSAPMFIVLSIYLPGRRVHSK